MEKVVLKSMQRFQRQKQDKHMLRLVNTKLSMQQRERDFHQFLEKHKDDKELQKAVDELRKIMPERKFIQKYLGARGTNGEKSIFEVKNQTYNQSHFNERFIKQEYDSDSDREGQPSYVPNTLNDQAIRRIIMSSIAHQMIYNFNNIIPSKYLDIQKLNQEQKMQRHIQEYDELYHQVHPEMTNWYQVLEEKNALKSDFNEQEFERERQRIISKAKGVESRYFLELMIGLGLGGLFGMGLVVKKLNKNQQEIQETIPTNQNTQNNNIDTQQPPNKYLGDVLAFSGYHNIAVGGFAFLFTSMKLTKLRYAMLGYALVSYSHYKLQTQIKDQQDYDIRTKEYQEGKFIDKDYEQKLQLVEENFKKLSDKTFINLTAGYGLVLAYLYNAKFPFSIMKFIPHILVVNGFQQLAMSFLNNRVRTQQKDSVKQEKDDFFFQRWCELSSVIVSIYASSLLQYYGIKYFGQTKIFSLLYILPIALALNQTNTILQKEKSKSVNSDLQDEFHSIQDKLDMMPMVQLIWPFKINDVKSSFEKVSIKHEDNQTIAKIQNKIEVYTDKEQLIDKLQKLNHNVVSCAAECLHLDCQQSLLGKSAIVHFNL